MCKYEEIEFNVTKGSERFDLRNVVEHSSIPVRFLVSMSHDDDDDDDETKTKRS